MFKPKGVMILTLVLTLLSLSCSGPESEQPVLRAEVPLHLEEHIDDARIEGSEVPKDALAAVEWDFTKPQPDWKVVIPWRKDIKPLQMTQAEDSLHLVLNEATKRPESSRGGHFGGIWVDVPNWQREDWAYIMVRARTRDEITWLAVGFNLQKPGERGDFLSYGDGVDVIKDGSAHTYLMRADWSGGNWEDPWRQLGLNLFSREPASIDILSVSVISKDVLFSNAPAGLSTQSRSGAHRRTLFTHAQGKLEYRVRVPKAGRLDVGLGVLKKTIPITFKVTASPKEDDSEILLEETYSDKDHWSQHSVDLSNMAGQTVKLRLEADTERAGTVALWATPTISGIRMTEKLNIILYVIDGASADYMSIYGYNRRTTPNLERLTEEGAVFEHAYSNCTWTKASNPSFMTSLYHSVLGGYKSSTDQLPENAITMAELMHDAGYQTGVFTTNPWCGTGSGFQRGVDWLRQSGVENNMASSSELHKDFWEWREAYPGEPYWVHFQTTDVHWPWNPVTPFAGLFLRPELRERYYQWEEQIAKAAGLNSPMWPTPYRYPLSAFESTGINHLDFFESARALNDEAMAHNDYQIGKMVERLKRSGEWEHTLLIVAADHGSPFGLGLLDPIPPLWGPRFRSHQTRIPLIFVWPERIAPGQRFRQPVSMIDLLPTILDLVGIPAPELMQGQSLAPLLLEEKGWEPRPIIFDEFYLDGDTGDLVGDIEVIDGKWGASLNIDPRTDDKKTPIYRLGPLRPTSLLLYDIWNDPNCLVPLNEERPNLVKKYTEFLEAKWKEHQELAKRFSELMASPLTPEQLETLRSLGYIR